MVKIALIIPCHIEEKDNINTAEKCLKSVLEAHAQPCQYEREMSIFVVLSFENNEVKKAFAPFIRQYNKFVKFIINSKYQSELAAIHKVLKFLSSFDLIMFCQYNGIYSKYRITEFTIAYEECLANEVAISGIKDNQDDAKFEYYHYGLTYKTLVAFYSLFENKENSLSENLLSENSLSENKENYMHLLNHPHSLMYLKSYIIKLSSTHKWAKIDKLFYSTPTLSNYDKMKEDVITKIKNHKNKSLTDITFNTVLDSVEELELRFMYKQYVINDIIDGTICQDIDFLTALYKMYSIDDTDVKNLIPFIEDIQAVAKLF